MKSLLSHLINKAMMALRTLTCGHCERKKTRKGRDLIKKNAQEILLTDHRVESGYRAQLLQLIYGGWTAHVYGDCVGLGSFQVIQKSSSPVNSNEK